MLVSYKDNVYVPFGIYGGDCFGGSQLELTL